MTHLLQNDLFTLSYFLIWAWAFATAVHTLRQGESESPWRVLGAGLLLGASIIMPALMLTAMCLQ